MKLRSLLFSLLAVSGLFACSDDDNPGAQTMAVELPFEAVVGSEAFACDQTFTGLGEGADLTPTDFRFYVHDVRYVTADGAEFPVTLTDDGRFQNGRVALLDFEAGCGDMGNAETNNTIRGTVEAGDYVGVRFRIGVPSDLNHANAAEAGAPLNLTAMWWNWNGGYKFARIEGRSSAFDGWRLHLGATGCTGDMMGTSTCTNQNIVDVSIDGNPSDLRIAADIAALVEGSTLGNTMDTAPGCMSAPNDPECGPIFENLGLAFGGQAAGTQSFLRAL